MTGDRYKPGSLQTVGPCPEWLDDDGCNCMSADYHDEREMVIQLPHQCDAWRIGTVEDAKALLRDLTELIVELEAKP